MGGVRISPQIISYLRERPNRTVQVEYIAKGLRLEPKQIQQAISRMVREEAWPDGKIEVVKRGNSWKWSPGQIGETESAQDPDSPLPEAPRKATVKLEGKPVSPYQLVDSQGSAPNEPLLQFKWLGTFTDGSILIKGAGGPHGESTFIARQI